MRSLTCLCVVLAWVPASMGGEKQLSAEQMMAEAHEARAIWDKSFPGFTAKLTVNVNGEEISGKLTVTAAGKVELDLPKSENAEWARQQLKSIASHRFAGARDKYNVSFADKVTNHPLGRLIKFNESTSHSVYRIKGNLITEVHREMGDRKFTISVSTIATNPEGKLLPSHFNVSYWDIKSGQLIRNEDYQEEWIRLGKFDLPKRRLNIETGANERMVAEILLSDHQLLPIAGNPK